MPRHQPLLTLPRAFVGSRAVADGLLTSRQLRGRRVQRLVQGVYGPANLDRTHGLLVEAVGLVLAPGCVVTGRSAATVLGISLATAADPVEVLVPWGCALVRRSGVSLRVCREPPVAAGRWRSAALASWQRITFDLAARRDLVTGVALLDALLRNGRHDIDDFRSGLVELRCHDVSRVRAAAALVDPRAESQPESRVRVHLVLAGIAGETQVDVRAHGEVVARVDVAVVGRKIVIEYDGAWHVLREQLERDRRRLNALREAGWEVVHVTADMLRRPDEVVGAVLAALAGRAGAR